MRRSEKDDGEREAAAAELERGRASYAKGDWEDAFGALSHADEAAPLGADDLELLAFSAALTGRDDAMLQALERQYQALVDTRECLRAARAAFWIGMRLFALAEPGRASGWISRAQQVVEREGRDCAEQGLLLLPVVVRHLETGDHDAAHAAAARAVELGERFGDPDVIAFARNLQGRALMRKGEVAEGLALVDGVMVAVTSGELSPLVAGLVYCNAIASCQQVHALDRAREWTAALARWCEKQPQLVTFTGICLVHRAELMQLGGDWPEAYEEVERACQRISRASDPEAFADAHYQRAELHRLRGELEAAEEAYRSASELGREPHPGLALLRLSQGRREEAVNAIRRVLSTTTLAWHRTRFLPACVEIMVAAGELEEARTASRELDELAERFGTEILGAMAAHARGAVSLAEGDAQGAVEPLRRAFQVWQRVGAPYIAARIRVLLGRAFDILGDRDGARLEQDAARLVFQELGASLDLVALDLPAAHAAAARDHGLTQREVEVLRRVARGKTNKAIAAELFVSQRTIDRHVSNIFAKLNVSSRAAATAFAYEHGLV